MERSLLRCIVIPSRKYDIFNEILSPPFLCIVIIRNAMPAHLYEVYEALTTCIHVPLTREWQYRTMRSACKCVRETAYTLHKLWSRLGKLFQNLYAGREKRNLCAYHHRNE